jgi:hypothetical protein
MGLRSREWSECLRKFCHPHYLSAMQHANKLSDREGLTIYPCSFCDYLHVGHQRHRSHCKSSEQSTRSCGKPLRAEHELAWRIAKSKQKISIKEKRIANFNNPRPKTLLRHVQSLQDMRAHLARLEDLEGSGDSVLPLTTGPQTTIRSISSGEKIIEFPAL